MANASKGDIKLYKGVFLERIYDEHNGFFDGFTKREIDEHLKLAFFGKNISTTEIDHDTFQIFKLAVKDVALNDCGIELDDNDPDIQLNWH